MKTWIIGCVVLATACGKDGESSDDSSTGASAESCGDVDGAGGDTGDVPNLLGAWTTTFGQNLYDDGFCSVPGLEVADIQQFMNQVFTIDGRAPDGLYAHFGAETDLMPGLINANGGVVFTGTRQEGSHTLYVSVGGLLYRQPQTDRDEIRGFGYIGVDKDGADTVIDCWLQGDFRATRSGN